MRIGKLDVGFGAARVRRWRLWLPDGLHVWWGDRGCHVFWSGGCPHLIRDTAEWTERHDA